MTHHYLTAFRMGARTREGRRALKRIAAERMERDHYLGRGPRIAAVHECINAKARVRAQLDQMGNPARVLIVADKMDCDCARYTTIHETEAMVMRVARAMFDTYADAEGPVYACYLAPVEDRDEHRRPTRDLALEAFEDGHPHIVYA